jgi:hypothetical protein
MKLMHNIFRHITNAFRTPAPSLRGRAGGEAVLGLGVVLLTLTSCIDTIILPDDKTVEEDFWKTKTQVQSMVNGAYSSLASEEVQRKLVIWQCRSDELNVNTSLSINELNQFDSNNLQTDNRHNSWASMYSVINTCNLIISKSAEVMDIDPNYLEGDHKNVVAQMKALRGLCYFYLIRAFRDVPLVLEPYKESSQELKVGQTAAGVVLDQIISDLEEVMNDALSTANVTDNVQKYGCFTRNSIYALLADCYLWRASVNHSVSDYRRCVELCDMVRDARGSVVKRLGNSSQLDDDGYNLNLFRNYFRPFVSGNDGESLLELLFSDNTALCNAYYKSKSNSNAKPWFYTNSYYSSIKKNANIGLNVNVFNQLHTGDVVTDIRGFESVYNFNSGVEDEVMIRKYVAQNVMGDVVVDVPSNRSYSGYRTNWIVYRVTDVMLMKAEAMVQIASLMGEDVRSSVSQIANAGSLHDSVSIAKSVYSKVQEISNNLVTGMRQVQIVNTRAQKDGISLYDSLAYKLNVQEAETSDFVKAVANYVSSLDKMCEDLELEVMNERARELCFEGKRWYDMLRYNYRHMSGVNYNTLMVDLGDNQAKNYDGFLTLMARKYTNRNGSALVANVKTEPYLYLPVLKSEVEINNLLKQNPAYKDRATAERQ